MDHPDDRSALAVAVAWASHVTSIALEMALPTLLGHWIDRWLGTGIVFLLVGAVSGFVVGMWHLLRFARYTSTIPSRPDSPDERSPRHCRSDLPNDDA